MTTDTPGVGPTPAEQLAALIGDDNARTAINAGWDAIRHTATTSPVPDAFLADYIAGIVVAALTALNRKAAAA